MHRIECATEATWELYCDRFRLGERESGSVDIHAAHRTRVPCSSATSLRSERTSAAADRLRARLRLVTVATLDREMFSEAEAARLLRVAQSTLHYWLEGGKRGARIYEPVIRIQPEGRRSVTWAEFIESGLLRQYRREHKVPMAELRAFIDGLRERMGVPYPLAHERPFVADRQLVREAQDEAGLDAEYCLVAEARGQLVLTGPSELFVQRVGWAEGIAESWRPHEDPRSPVSMRPGLRFGRPAIKGISTEVLWEHAEAGEDLGEVAEVFGLSVEAVRWALAYETTTRAA